MKTLFLTALLFALSSPLFAQGFTAYLSDQTFVLHSNRDGSGDPIADGNFVYVFWDSAAPGRDCTDRQPIVGGENDNGRVNFNRFTMNGTADLAQAGLFYANLALVSNGGMMLAGPNRFFIVVPLPTDSTHAWVSDTLRVTDASPVELTFNSWSCLPNCWRVPVLHPTH